MSVMTDKEKKDFFEMMGFTEEVEVKAKIEAAQEEAEVEEMKAFYGSENAGIVGTKCRNSFLEAMDPEVTRNEEIHSTLRRKGD